MKVLYFTASWCMPCKSMKPVFEDTIKNYNFEKEYVDIEDNPELTQKYNVKGVPTIVVANGEEKVVDSIVGVVPKNKLVEMFDKIES